MLALSGISPAAASARLDEIWSFVAMKEKAAKRKGAGELIESLRRQGIDEAVLSAALDEAHVEGVEARGPR